MVWILIREIREKINRDSISFSIRVLRLITLLFLVRSTSTQVQKFGPMAMERSIGLLLRILVMATKMSFISKSSSPNLCQMMTEARQNWFLQTQQKAFLAVSRDGLAKGMSKALAGRPTDLGWQSGYGADNSLVQRL
jgi:hypothetical protein